MKLRTLGVALSAVVMATVASVNVSAEGRHKRHGGHDMATFSLAYANAVGLNTAIEAAFEGQNAPTLLAAMPNHHSRGNSPEYLVVLSIKEANGSNTRIATRINALDGQVIESDTLGFFSRMRRHMKVEDEALSKVKLTPETAIQTALTEASAKMSSESQAKTSDIEPLMIRMTSSYGVPLYSVTVLTPNKERPVTIGVNAETGNAKVLPSYGRHGGKHHGKKHWEKYGYGEHCDDDDDDDDDDHEHDDDDDHKDESST